MNPIQVSGDGSVTVSVPTTYSQSQLLAMKNQSDANIANLQKQLTGEQSNNSQIAGWIAQSATQKPLT